MKYIGKKLAITIAVAAVLCLSVGCNSVVSKSSSTDDNSVAQSADENSNEAEKPHQPDPLEPTKAPETEESEAETKAPEDTSAPAEEATADPNFNVDTDKYGAVSFKPSPDATNAQLIKAGQTMFETACEYDWKFHVGCPYPLDYQTYVENDLGWQFFLVTDPNIKSLADVEADYFHVFSESNGSDLDELYVEKNGRLYALDGARGTDVFYESSVITSVKERTVGKVVFTVENNYSGDDFGDTPHTETDEFIVEIDDSGSWKVTKFALPY